MSTRTDDVALTRTIIAAHAVKPTIDDLHGVFATLAKQHGEVSSLMKRVEDDADKRAELWPQIRTQLLTHERSELRAVFPELRMNAETLDLADQHEDDAIALEGFIQELDGTAIESNMWGAKFASLATTVRHHAAEEEKEIFPRAQAVLGKTRTNALDAELLAAEKQLAQTA